MYWNSFTGIGKGGLTPGQEFDSKGKDSMSGVRYKPMPPGETAT